jgi:hypothetical protein
MIVVFILFGCVSTSTYFDKESVAHGEVKGLFSRIYSSMGLLLLLTIFILISCYIAYENY